MIHDSWFILVCKMLKKKNQNFPETDIFSFVFQLNNFAAVVKVKTSSSCSKQLQYAVVFIYFCTVSTTE